MGSLPLSSFSGSYQRWGRGAFFISKALSSLHSHLVLTTNLSFIQGVHYYPTSETKRPRPRLLSDTVKVPEPSATWPEGLLPGTQGWSVGLLSKPATAPAAGDRPPPAPELILCCLLGGPGLNPRRWGLEEEASGGGMGLGGQRSQLPTLFCTPPPPHSSEVTTRGQLCPCTPLAPSSENSQGQTGSYDL